MEGATPIDLTYFTEGDRDKVLSGLQLAKHLFAGPVGNIKHYASKLPEGKERELILRDIETIRRYLLSFHK